MLTGPNSKQLSITCRDRWVLQTTRYSLEEVKRSKLTKEYRRYGLSRFHHSN